MKTHQLKNKGWTKEEITEAQSLLEKAKYHDVFFSKIVFWSALLVIVLGNMALSLVLVPFLLIFKTWLLHTLVVILALMMGTIYSFLITDIGYLETKHHVLASILVPVIALVNLVAVVIASNSFARDISAGIADIRQPHNQWLVAAIFVVAFILPFLMHRLWKFVKTE